MIAILRNQFSKIQGGRRQGSVRFSPPDTLYVALAMFQFKYPSMLQFDEVYQADEVLIGNLLRLYALDEVTSDTQKRAILDNLSPSELRPAFRALHSTAQRGKVLEDALAANAPHIHALVGYGMDYIINIQPVGNASLFAKMHNRFVCGE